MSGAAAVNRLNDAYLARLETLARMTSSGIISVNEGKNFRAQAKKLWKQEVKLHQMPGAPPSVASVLVAEAGSASLTVLPVAA